MMIGLDSSSYGTHLRKYATFLKNMFRNSSVIFGSDLKYKVEFKEHNKMLLGQNKQ